MFYFFSLPPEVFFGGISIALRRCSMDFFESPICVFLEVFSVLDD